MNSKSDLNIYSLADHLASVDLDVFDGHHNFPTHSDPEHYASLYIYDPQHRAKTDVIAAAHKALALLNVHVHVISGTGQGKFAPHHYTVLIRRNPQ